jgi:hypothetical protein
LLPPLFLWPAGQQKFDERLELSNLLLIAYKFVFTEISNVASISVQVINGIYKLMMLRSKKIVPAWVKFEVPVKSEPDLRTLD